MGGLNNENHLIENTPLFIWGNDGADKIRSANIDNVDAFDHQDRASVATATTHSSKKRKNDRRTPSQVHELEDFFKICPHPDEKQKVALGHKVGMDSQQIKFWFQNKRTQLKTQLERHEFFILKEQYDHLKHENNAMKDYIGNPHCKGCGGGMLEYQLKSEIAHLKDELIRVSGIAEKFVGKPIYDIASSFSQPQMGGPILDNRVAIASSSTCSTVPYFSDRDKCMYLHVAKAAANELIILAQNDPPFWRVNFQTGDEMFNHQAYTKKFNPYGVCPLGFTYEATREAGSVIMSSLELVHTLMTPTRWANMFPCMVGKASTLSVLCDGVSGTHAGELLLMEAEIIFPSPLVPLRQVRFLRYCKNISEGGWAVVDISIDPLTGSHSDITKRCRRLPSGYCITQDAGNVYSLVTCVEHAEYDERQVHNLFRPQIQSGFGFGAKRLLATLQRQCEYADFLPRTGITPLESSIGLTLEGRESVMKLTRRMMNNFCAGICASSGGIWEKLTLGNIEPELQAMARVSIGEPGEVSGVILSFATSVWMPVSRRRLFDFLRNGDLRGHWDMLVDSGPLDETVRISKSNNPANCITILCPPSEPGNEGKDMVVLQESWTDRTNSGVVYATIDLAAITTVMEGEDSELVKLLPSGYVITDSFMDPIASNGVELVTSSSLGGSSSSLLTLGFQVLMDSAPNSKVSMNSIETVHELMSRTIKKIKVAMRCD